MRIACLGWGSLIWNKGGLLVDGEWRTNGPLLPVEFTRQSNNGRSTLVITDGAKPVQTLWALMTTNDLNEARESLRIREETAHRNIGSITCAQQTDDVVELAILRWAKTVDINAVVWTKLSPRFNGAEKAPNIEEAVTYLSSLNIDVKELAENYIRKAPKQIDTDFRRRFESEFGWSFIK